MRVGVVGAGGIGGLYGGLLAKAGHDVSFLARGEHLRAIQERGLRVQSAQFGTFDVQGAASDNPADLGPSDLVLFAVKTYDVDEAAALAAPMLAPDGVLLTFQNGLDTPDRIAERLGDGRVLIGTTAVETTILEPGVIGHLSPVHVLRVAELNGPPTGRVQELVETLRGADINAQVAEDGHRALWDKAVALIPMATATSVCRSSIGPIRDLPETRQFLWSLLDEAVAVGGAYGYDLAQARDQAVATLENWPSGAKASMARDFERGRRTELESITGALVRMADAKNVEVPVSRTAYALLKLRALLELPAGDEMPVGTASPGR